MNLRWIDIYVDGLIDHCFSRDVFEIYNVLNINIIKVSEDSLMLQGNESVYIRNYFGSEVVFLKAGLPYNLRRFILSHELGHAVLHTELLTAAYSKSVLNKGQLEKQADYFALRLLDVRLDSVCYEGLTKSQVARDLCVREECLDYIC